MKSLNFSVVFCSFHDNSSHTGDEEGNKQAGGILFSRDPRPAEYTWKAVKDFRSRIFRDYKTGKSLKDLLSTAESVRCCSVFNDFIKPGLYTRHLPSYVQMYFKEGQQAERQRARQTGLCGEPHVM